MAILTLDTARIILDQALAHGRARKMAPLAVVVLDARGAMKAFAAEDGTSLKRREIAEGKAMGALAFGLGSRSLQKRAKEHPHFMTAAGQAVGGQLVPVPGGVLMRTADGILLGAVGISGDVSDADEAAAIAGIEAAGLVADPGSD